MKKMEGLGIEFGNAICYSGYREGQSPVDQIYPSYEEVLEDLIPFPVNTDINNQLYSDNEP